MGSGAQVYPLKEWEQIEASLSKMSPMDPVRKKFQDVTNFYGQMAEMERTGPGADSAESCGSWRR